MRLSATLFAEFRASLDEAGRNSLRRDQPLKWRRIRFFRSTALREPTGAKRTHGLL
jgi:hypothetical protein